MDAPASFGSWSAVNNEVDVVGDGKFTSVCIEHPVREAVAPGLGRVFIGDGIVILTDQDR